VDAGLLRGHGHDAVERIDFPDEVTLADATDGRVATHLPDGFETLREQKCAGTQARCGGGGFGARMASAHHDHVKGVVTGHCVLKANRAPSATTF
jgi:hypothetical protein